MSFARIMALANRIIRQVLRDKRTLALIFIVPLVVMTLLYLVLTNTSSVHTLAIVRPMGVGSDRIDTLITALLPGKDKLNTIYVNASYVNDTLKVFGIPQNWIVDASGVIRLPVRPPG